MNAHDCDQECPCGHWSRKVHPRVVGRVDGRSGKWTLDVIDQTYPDQDDYSDYEREEV